MATGLAGRNTLSVERIKEAMKQVIIETDKAKISIPTNDVVESFLLHKKHAGISEESRNTYMKRLMRFIQQFPTLPLDTDILINYLAQFNGGTGRYKRNQKDLLSALYNHSINYFNIPFNPLSNLERPQVIKKPIHTLSFIETILVNSVIITPTERVSWE